MNLYAITEDNILAGQKIEIGNKIKAIIFQQLWWVQIVDIIKEPFLCCHCNLIEKVSENRWIIDTLKSKEHILDIHSEDKSLHAYVKWDGCIDFYRAYNGTDATDPNNDDKCYIHMCDIDDWIKMLQEMKQSGQDWFKDNGYWD